MLLDDSTLKKDDNTRWRVYFD